MVPSAAPIAGLRRMRARHGAPSRGMHSADLSRVRIARYACGLHFLTVATGLALALAGCAQIGGDDPATSDGDGSGDGSGAGPDGGSGGGGGGGGGGGDVVGYVSDAVP